MGMTWLAQRTRLAPLPLPLIVLGAITLVTTRSAPARTAKGSSVLQRARGCELYIAKAEARQLRFEELASQGWTLAEPTWYGGDAYGTFWLYSAGLGARMENFTSLADTTMSAPTPGSSGRSGFGGGGSSGG